jgi:hypothetical protein
MSRGWKWSVQALRKMKGELRMCGSAQDTAAILGERMSLAGRMEGRH